MTDGPLAIDPVFATKDRPIELRDALASLVAQTRQPNEVWVVDCSSEPDTKLVCEESWPFVVNHVATSPNPAAQRNLGARLSSADVVAYFDDDVVLEPGYIEAIESAFLVDPDRLGVGGLITNLPEFEPAWWRRALAPHSCRQGSVSPSGRPVLVYRAVGPIDSQWLSGCCMAFRRSAVLEEPFDELITGPLNEDVEMGYRVAQHGSLTVVPDARLVHLESPKNRIQKTLWVERDIICRYRQVSKGVGRYSMRSFWASVAAQLIVYSGRAAIQRSSTQLGYAKATVRASASVLRGRKRLLSTPYP